MVTLLMLILAIASARFFGGVFTIMLLPAAAVSFPGAMLAKDSEDRLENPRRFAVGLAYTVIAYNSAASVWIAVVVGFTFHLRQQNEIPFWMLWPWGLLVASLPAYYASRSYYAEREKQKFGIEGASPNYALETASGLGWLLSYPLFIGLALLPKVHHSLYGWLPWSQFVK